MLRMLIVVVCFILSACMVGPNYKEPQKSVMSQWVKNSPAIQTTRPHHEHWWTVFHDKNLTDLICQGYQNNLSLQIAGVRVLQMRAQLAQSVGGLYPQNQALMGNYSFQRIGGSSLQDLLPTTFETATLGFTASWELDFWGKYRRAIQSNNAEFLASYAAYNNALVTLMADIASNYINLRTQEALINVTKSNIKVQTLSYNIAKAHYEAGQTSLLDVEQAQTELSQTKAKLPPYMYQLQRQKDILAFLLGTVPNDVDHWLAKSHGIPKAPPKVAVGIPIEALAQRPDIHQARLEAIAQSEAIGAVKASLFPSLTLSGTFALSSNSIPPQTLSQIFNISNGTITTGPNVNWPILNYGQITNAVRVQDAAFQQALLRYLNLVLKAQQEVQDNLSRYSEALRAEHDLAIANKAATSTTKLALVRYKEGESSYTTVLYAEQQQLQIQTALTNAQGEIGQALVALYRALGGGWQIGGRNDIVSIKIKQDMAKRTYWGNLLQPEHHLPPTTKSKQIKQRYLPNW